MYRFLIILTTIILCCCTSIHDKCSAQDLKYSIEERFQSEQDFKDKNLNLTEYNTKKDFSNSITEFWQEYNLLIIISFIFLIIIIILSFLLFSAKSQNREILLRLNSRYNHIKNLESDAALLTNILKAANANSWVINLNKNEIYYINDNIPNFKVVTGNSLRSCFINYIHPDYQQIFIDKLKNCSNKSSKDFDITYLLHRKHSKHEYEWYWSRGIVTNRRDISGKPYLALSGITINIEKLKRGQIELENSESQLKTLKESCRSVRFEIAKEINETLRNNKKIAKELASADLKVKERKSLYKQLNENNKKVNDFIARTHKILK